MQTVRKSKMVLMSNHRRRPKRKLQKNHRIVGHMTFMMNLNKRPNPVPNWSTVMDMIFETRMDHQKLDEIAVTSESFLSLNDFFLSIIRFYFCEFLNVTKNLQFIQQSWSNEVHTKMGR